jgi:upstream activation factor subunit UAF30
MLKTQSEFAARIAAIHSGAKGDTDIRHEELQAMFDTFLGRNSDAKRRKEVERAQINLIRKQGELEAALEKEKITPEEYVDSFNQLLAQTFRDCEEILGPKDFRRLFGAPPSKQGGFIDKEAFLQTVQPKAYVQPYAVVAKKARRPQAAFMRPIQPDDKLSAIVGSKPLPRSELTKKLWDYIKKNGLQDKKKRTQINADDALRSVFNGKSHVSLFEMTKLISRHLR